MLPHQKKQVIEHELSQLLQGNIFKLQLSEINKNEFELNIKGIVTCYLYKRKDIFWLNYLDLDEKLIEKYPIIQSTSQDRHLHIKNEEIRTYFEKAFMEANDELLIISPWLTSYVVSNLSDYFDNAISRGVRIKIMYGYSGDRLQESKLVAEGLKIKYGNNMELIERNTHYKLVICDNKFYLMGSMNFLSFGGDYSRRKTRDEGAIYSNSTQEIGNLKDVYFDNLSAT